MKSQFLEVEASTIPNHSENTELIQNIGTPVFLRI